MSAFMSNDPFNPGGGGGGGTGPAGPPGAAATITVGSTLTGAAGSAATVTNSGTANAAILNFSIPAGDPGEAGVFAGTAMPPATPTGGEIWTRASDGKLFVYSAAAGAWIQA